MKKPVKPEKPKQPIAPNKNQKFVEETIDLDPYICKSKVYKADGTETMMSQQDFASYSDSLDDDERRNVENEDDVYPISLAEILKLVPKDIPLENVKLAFKSSWVEDCYPSMYARDPYISYKLPFDYAAAKAQYDNDLSKYEKDFISYKKDLEQYKKDMEEYKKYAEEQKKLKKKEKLMKELKALGA